jgi:phage terminase small subunit
MDNNPNSLTEKQKRFADYYIESGNGSEAAKKAGYKAKDLYQLSSENLRKPNIKRYIDQRIAEKDSKRIMKQDEILEILTSLARGEITEEVIHVLGCGDFIQEIQVTDKHISHKDRIKALELLGKRYRLWDVKDEENVTKVIIVDNIEKALKEGVQDE